MIPSRASGGIFFVVSSTSNIDRACKRFKRASNFRNRTAFTEPRPSGSGLRAGCRSGMSSLDAAPLFGSGSSGLESGCRDFFAFRAKRPNYSRAELRTSAASTKEKPKIDCTGSGVIPYQSDSNLRTQASFRSSRCYMVNPAHELQQHPASIFVTALDDCPVPAVFIWYRSLPELGGSR